MLHGFVFTDLVEIVMLREKLLTSGLHDVCSCRIVLQVIAASVASISTPSTPARPRESKSRGLKRDFNLGPAGPGEWL